MGYFIVPVNAGVIDIDYNYLVEGIQVLDCSQCYVKLAPGYTIRELWTEITEYEFNQQKAIITEPPA